mgnify:CR=1 FL=1
MDHLERAGPPIVKVHSGYIATRLLWFSRREIHFKREYDGYVARLLTSGVTGFAIALTVSRNCRKIKNRRCRSRSVTEIEPQLIASYTREREREREKKDVIFQNANRQASLCVFFSSAMNVKNVSRLSLCRTIHHKIPP